MSRAATTLAVGALAMAATAAGVSGQSKSTWDGVFSQDQAGRGRALYGVQCSSCHGPDLGGIDAAPALVGGRFASNWNGVIIADMVDRIRISMPQNAPGTLNRQQVTDVLAYILNANGFPAGERDLPRQAGFQRDIAYSAYKNEADAAPPAAAPHSGAADPETSGPGAAQAVFHGWPGPR